MRIAINGFGRIGRNFLRCMLQDPTTSQQIQVVAINIGKSDPQFTAHMFKYDTLMGTLPELIVVENDQLLVGDYKINIIAQLDAEKLPWKKLDIDWVVDCSGKFTHRQDAQKHIKSGAKKVLISAPAHDEDVAIIPGVNEELFDAKQHNFFKREQDIMVLLENTCHANLAVGSDILDLQHVLEKIDRPERLGFCIDTAHAHSFGYDITTDEGQQTFINLLEKTIGIERIKLIHLNDTTEKLGSFIDRHDSIGQGIIGENALKRFAMHAALQHIPLLIESPELSVADEGLILNKVLNW